MTTLARVPAGVVPSPRPRPAPGSANSRRRATAASRARPRWFMASGRFAVISTSSTAPGPSPSTVSTTNPTAVSRSRSVAVAGGSPGRYDAIHSWRNFIRPSPGPVQETDVVLEEEAEVGNAVGEHRDPVVAAAEREPAVAVRVDAAVRENLRVDHPGPHDLDPARARADAAPLLVAEDARDGHFDARLDEREESR